MEAMSARPSNPAMIGRRIQRLPPVTNIVGGPDDWRGIVPPDGTERALVCGLQRIDRRRKQPPTLGQKRLIPSELP
jgi:hypothetical protein